MEFAWKDHVTWSFYVGMEPVLFAPRHFIHVTCAENLLQGKSTFIKNLICKFNGGPSSEQREKCRKIIRRNIVERFQNVVEVASRLNLSFGPLQVRISSILNIFFPLYWNQCVYECHEKWSLVEHLRPHSGERPL